MRFYLTRNNGLASLLIRARMSFSKKRIEHWSHGLVDLGAGQAIDSTFKLGGVVKRPLVEALGHTKPHQRLHVWVPLQREDEAREWGLSREGTPYDTRAVFGWGVGDRDWHDPNAEFCFEYIAAWIERGSDYRFPDKRRVSGGDLLRAALELGGAHG